MQKVRSQGVILLKDKILIAKHFNYINNEEFWLLPGGSVKEKESPEEGIIREIKEETNFDIEIKEVLFDSKGDGRDAYSRYFTYLCKAKNYENLKIGFETNSNKKIIDLIWVSIIDENTWNKYLVSHQFYPSMKEIKEQLIKLRYIE